MRQAAVERRTRETDIFLEINIDGRGDFSGSCGIGFFDHMLELFCRHGLFDLTLRMTGDLQVDNHHSIEDLGLVLGQAMAAAIGDKKGIARYGMIFLPMDEALVQVSLDWSGRAFLALDLTVPTERIGALETEMIPEFLQALVVSGGITLHVRKLAGTNSHHIVEALFKGLARSLRQAAAIDSRETGIPSSKGRL